MTPARRAVAAAMSEKELMANVVTLARLLGWRTFHQLDSRGSEAGWPDLFLLHPERRCALAMELKSEGGRLTKAQARTLALLEGAGIATYVLRPSQWLGGEVDAVLRGEAVSTRPSADRA